MATQAYKEKRIKAAKAKKSAYKKAKEKAQEVIDGADKAIADIDATLAWLESMPVEPEKEEKA